MPDRKQWFLLLLVFVLAGIGVATVRWFTDRNTLAWVRVVPHDGQIVSGGLTGISEILHTKTVNGVFYQAQVEPYLLPFQGSLQPPLLAELKNKDASLKWYNVNPDSLFLRAWSGSYARMLMALPEAVRDSINLTSERYNRLRTLAVIAKGQRRDSLLRELGANMDELTMGKYTSMRKRFAQQLLHASNKKMARQPGNKWVFLVDIELFPYIRDAIERTSRYQLEE